MAYAHAGVHGGGRHLPIACAPEVMEAIRAAVADGYYKLARGGLEVGGVLFGRRNRDTVEILTFRPIECQHAYGPSFKLSEADLAGLSKLLDSVRVDPALAGMVPVGWYLSHTRTDPVLSEPDLEIHNRYFPERWHVALVMRPERYGPTKAVFHTRDEHGIPRQEPALILEPAPSALKPPPPPAPQEQPVEQPVKSEDFEIFSLPASRSNRFPWVLFALAWLIAVASTVFAVRSYWWPKAPPPLGLTLQDMNGQLAILWDKSALEIREAEGGVLEIEDGAKKYSLRFNTNEIRKGNVVYSRQTGDVTARLRASLPRGRSAEGIARFAGQPVQHAPAPETDGADLEIQRLTSELQRLNAALAKQDQRNRDLEAAIAALRKRMAAGP